MKKYYVITKTSFGERKIWSMWRRSDENYWLFETDTDRQLGASTGGKSESIFDFMDYAAQKWGIEISEKEYKMLKLKQ